MYSTLIHEREHAIIECENWETDSTTIGVEKEYISLWDSDGDGYKDVCEWSHLIGCSCLMRLMKMSYSN